MSLSAHTIIGAILAFGIGLNGAARAQQEDDPGKFADANEKHSYAVGMQFGTFLQEGKDLIDLDTVYEAMEAAMAGEELRMTPQEAGVALQQFQVKMQGLRAERMNREGAAYLAANQEKEGVQVTGSGLQYKVIEEGTGERPQATDTVRVHYRGTFVNGEQFDSSYDSGQPAEFPVNRVIPGWTEALQLMKEGAKYELCIPYQLAYGERGQQPIPGYATLLFEVELLEIVDAPSR